MAIIPVIDVHQNNGILVTTSRNVAEVFEKNHADILRDIRTLLDRCSDDFGLSNFAESSYTNAQNKTQPEYLITKDGLVMLIMGYTGESAMKFKEAYIKRFNEMEKQLKEKKQEPALTVMTLDQKVSLAKIILECAGITGNQLALALDKGVRTDTGTSLISWSGTQLEAPIQQQLATPTQLGRIVGTSARKVNLLLEELGYQVKTDNGWAPTKLGLEVGGTLLDVNKAHSDGTPVRQLKWPFSLTTELQQALSEE